MKDLPVVELPIEIQKREDEGTDARFPLAFFVPAAWMMNARGDGPIGRGAPYLYDELSRALRKLGYATFRFAVADPEAQPFNETQVREIFSQYQEALAHPRVDPSRALLVGMCEGADLIARAYYDFFSIRRPEAAVLLSPTVRPLHLNQLTCAYLIIHGAEDPQFRFMPYAKIVDAVHHHQMRYGDSTTGYLVPDVGSELGLDKLDARVVEQLSFWIKNFSDRRRESAA